MLLYYPAAPDSAGAGLRAGGILLTLAAGVLLFCYRPFACLFPAASPAGPAAGPAADRAGGPFAFTRWFFPALLAMAGAGILLPAGLQALTGPLGSQGPASGTFPAGSLFEARLGFWELYLIWIFYLSALPPRSAALEGLFPTAGKRFSSPAGPGPAAALIRLLRAPLVLAICCFLGSFWLLHGAALREGCSLSLLNAELRPLARALPAGPGNALSPILALISLIWTAACLYWVWRRLTPDRLFPAPLTTGAGLALGLILPGLSRWLIPLLSAAFPLMALLLLYTASPSLRRERGRRALTYAFPAAFFFGCFTALYQYNSILSLPALGIPSAFLREFYLSFLFAKWHLTWLPAAAVFFMIGNHREQKKKRADS